MNDNLSILGANTLELHYWVDDNSHQINAYVQNKCEKELLDILSAEFNLQMQQNSD